MKRRYFVKSMLFLLLTAMVFLSVTAYGDDVVSEKDPDLLAWETEVPDPAETSAPEEDAEIVYTGNLNCESPIHDAVLKLNGNGTCELTVIIGAYFMDEPIFFFDFYTNVPDLFIEKVKMYVQSEGTYEISEAGVLSAVFDRSVAYAEFAPDADEKYKQTEYNKITYWAGRQDYYTALFNGESADLILYDLSLTAIPDPDTGVFLPLEFTQNDARGMTLASVSYLYDGKAKVKEIYARYDRHLSDLEDFATYANWPLNRFHETEFRKDGTRIRKRELDGAGRAINELMYSRNGTVFSLVRFNKDGTIEYSSGVYPVGGRIEDSVDEYGTQIRKVYDKYGWLELIEKTKYDSFGTYITERYESVSQCVTSEQYHYGQKVWTTESLYNDFGILMGTISYDSADELRERETYEYYENGSVKTSTRYDEKDSILLCEKYDEDGVLKESLYFILFSIEGENVPGWTMTSYGAAENGGNLTAEYDENWNLLNEYVWS